MTMNPPKLALAKPMSILLAEDNKVNQILTSGLLRSLGYEADIVADGRQAIDLALSKNFDLIFMDCQLPGIDGYEAARQIKDRRGNAPIIVAYTAHISEKEIIRCKDAGMPYTLGKPFSIEALTTLLTKVYDTLPRC